MFNFLLIKDYNYNCTYIVIALIYTYKRSVILYIPIHKLVTHSFYWLSIEIHFSATPDSLTFTMISTDPE
jgi:hypothetical protein